MTSRDFRAIADILSKDPSFVVYPDRAAYKAWLTAEFADLLGRANPRFDRDRFVTAVLGTPTKGDKPRASDYAR